MPRRLALVLLLLALGCRSAAPPAPPAPPAAPPPAAGAPPPVPSPVPVASPAPPVPEPTPAATRAEPTASLPGAVRWVGESAEYRALLRQVYRAATEQAERAAAGRSAGAWAVVLDADETVISNLAYQQERARLGRGFDRESWHAWVLRREAVPLPGAAAFLARVRALGGRIAIVTNRTESQCPATADVFQAHGLPYDVMLCRPDAGSSDKNPRFESVAQGTAAPGLPALEVVAFIGDNIHDFPGLSQALRDAPEAAFAPFGARFFVLPNPLYGSWE